MKLSSLLLDLLYPRKCPFCQHLVEGDALLCPDCQRTLPWLTDAIRESALVQVVWVMLTPSCSSSTISTVSSPDEPAGMDRLSGEIRAV